MTDRMTIRVEVKGEQQIDVPTDDTGVLKSGDGVSLRSGGFLRAARPCRTNTDNRNSIELTASGARINYDGLNCRARPNRKRLSRLDLGDGANVWFA